MNEEIIIDKNAKQITFTNNGIGFSQFGIANEILDLIENQAKEIEKLNNIIYTTLEYVDREEINSIGTPYTYTERGKHIKELLEGERTFNSLWQENKKLNNIINELEKDIEQQITFCTNEADATTNDKYCRIAINYLKHLKDKIKELKGNDK